MATVALTFDDGPDPVWTPRVMEALVDADTQPAPGSVRGTFFVRGEQFKHAPTVLHRLVDAGCEIQAHCYSHNQTHDKMSADEIARDITALLEAFEQHGLPRPILWRPPAGIVTEATRRVASGLDPPLPVTRWHIDSRDVLSRYEYALELGMIEHLDAAAYQEGNRAEDMLERIMTALFRDGGWSRDHAVVLLHDHPGANPARRDANETVRLIPMLVDAIRDRGGELAAHGSQPAGVIEAAQS
jgi:peptidoglycan-N-acetylglucosamine deacetylase